MVKQALIFRRDLKLSPGKQIVQGAHAAIGAYEDARAAQKVLWDRAGRTKIALTVATEAELWELRHRAELDHIPSYLVSDAGRTEVEAGTVTCLAIGPAEIDHLIGSLPLLKEDG